MKPGRSLLLIASATVVVLLLGGGLALKVGAEESSYRQAVQFAEILSLVMENYVDPVEAERLLEGAYQGLLGGLDPNGAFLSAAEVEEWKAPRPRDEVDPGIAILKIGRGVQVVSIDTGSPADDAGILIGDHVRRINGRDVRDLSLAQCRRLLLGKPGTELSLELGRASEGFEVEELFVARAPRRGPAYEVDVRDGVAVLTVRDLRRLATDALAEELDDVRSRGVRDLLLDLRNQSEATPREAAALAGLFVGGELRLRDRSGRVLESVAIPDPTDTWDGRLAILVNGATAGGAEAIAQLIQGADDVTLFGQSTFGLGAESELFELDNGSGLLVSSSLWETDAGRGWNQEGIAPDTVVTGRGDSLAERAADQLARVLELLTERSDDALADEPAPA